MIVIKNHQLNNETISALNLLIDMDINAVLAFKLMRIIKEVSSLVDDKIKLEKKIFGKYVEKDENGNPIQAIDDNNIPIKGAYKISDMEGFNREMSELMGIENTIAYDRVNFEDLNLTTVKIKDLAKIEFLFN